MEEPHHGVEQTVLGLVDPQPDNRNDDQAGDVGQVEHRLEGRLQASAEGEQKYRDDQGLDQPQRYYPSGVVEGVSQGDPEVAIQLSSIVCPIDLRRPKPDAQACRPARALLWFG